MRSVPAASFARLSSVPALWQALLRTQRDKRRTPTMARFLLNADRLLLGLHRRLREGSYRHGPFRLHVIRDPKVRLIAAAGVLDRVLHQALIHDLAPTFEAGFLPQHYAVGEGRGPLRAVLRYLTWTRQHRFHLQLDIRRYFLSMVHATLRGLFAQRLRDERTLALLDDFLRQGGRVYQAPLAREALGLAADPVPPGCGLPIGSYISQWSGALYLDGLDHFVKRALRIPGYLRYMDDFVLFSDDEAQLERAHAQVRDWLGSERGLTLNPKRGAVQPCQDASVFLGFRVDRGGVSPGPKMRDHLRRAVPAAARRGPEALARTLASYRSLYLF